MPTKDLPDYTRQMLLKYDEGFIGLPELAARLGSVVPGSMPGNLVFYDQFDSELTDYDVEGVGGLEAVRTSRHKFTGDWSVKMRAYWPTTSKYAALTRPFAYPGAKNCGLFTRVGWDTDAKIVVAIVLVYTGSRVLTIGVVYDYPSQELRVHTTAGAFYIVATSVKLAISDVVFYPILLTFDMENEKYGKLIFGHQEYDISNIAVRGLNSTASPRASVTVYPSGSALGDDFYIYLDSIAMTLDVE
jgi:hypothetical protein